MTFASFEEIGAWQEARRLMRLVRAFCGRARERKDYGWADQITRSTLSIMANIAEGNDAQSEKEFLVFLSYAKRSAAETRSHLYYALDEQYLTQAEFAEAADLAKKIASQLSNLMNYIRRSKRPRDLQTLKTFRR